MPAIVGGKMRGLLPRFPDGEFEEPCLHRRFDEARQFASPATPLAGQDLAQGIIRGAGGSSSKRAASDISEQAVR